MSAAGPPRNRYAVQLEAAHTESETPESETPEEGRGVCPLTLQQLPNDAFQQMMDSYLALALSKTSRTLRQIARAVRVDLIVHGKTQLRLWQEMITDDRRLRDKLNSFPEPWRVRVLRLRRCHMGATGAEELGTYLRGNTTLRELDVSYNDLRDAGGLALLDALRENATLHSLDISANGLREGAASAVAELLLLNTSLRSLKVEHNFFTHRSMQHIASALEQSAKTTLTSLSLKASGWCTNEAAEDLATFMRGNTTLRELNLADTHLKNDGGAALLLALHGNTTLHLLNLSNNCMLDLIAPVFGALVEFNTTLRSLDISHNLFSEAIVQHIASALGQGKNTTLSSLSIGGTDYDMNPQAVMALADTLLHNTTLVVLDLRSTTANLESLQALLDALRVNTTLARLDLRGVRTREKAHLRTYFDSHPGRVCFN